MAGYTSLAEYYRLTFALVQHHKYSLTEIEEMMPYERDIYVQMLLDFLEEQKEQQQRDAQRYRR